MGVSQIWRVEMLQCDGTPYVAVVDRQVGDGRWRS
jgi:hypothetical protein